jgi:hypothetical protein
MSEETPKHTGGNWSRGRIVYGAVVSDVEPTAEMRRTGHGDVEVYGGVLIAESILPNNIAIISAAPKLLAALKKAAERLSDELSCILECECTLDEDREPIHSTLDEHAREDVEDFEAIIAECEAVIALAEAQ